MVFQKHARAKTVIGAVAMLVVAGASSLARAEGPSFDCSKASAPVEILICSDSVLADQDLRLATAFENARKTASSPNVSRALLDDQRTWLKGRLAACLIRPTGDAPTDAETWAWAGCLSKQYDQRLSALKAPVPPAPNLSPHVRDADFVHPLCLDYALGGSSSDAPEPRAVDLKACNAAYAHIPVEQNEYSPNSLSVVGLTEGFPTWFDYQPVATLPDGAKLAITAANGGGSGTFTNLTSYRVDAKGQLTAVSYSVGGDRCNGGVASAALDSKGVRVSQTITPADVGQFMGLPDEQNTDLAFCASCCVGELESRLPLPLSPDAEPQPDMVTIDDVQVLTDSSDDPHSADACLLAALKSIAPSPPYSLTMAQVKSLKTPYLACLGKKKG